MEWRYDFDRYGSGCLRIVKSSDVSISIPSSSRNMAVRGSVALTPLFAQLSKKVIFYGQSSHRLTAFTHPVLLRPAAGLRRTILHLPPKRFSQEIGRAIRNPHRLTAFTHPVLLRPAAGLRRTILHLPPKRFSQEIGRAIRNPHRLTVGV